MSYANTTFAQAKAQLSQILGDTGNVFYTDEEVGVYIREALRTWGAMSLYWKDRGTFSTTASEAFYHLQDEIPDLLGYTVTDTDIVTDIQYALLEPPTGVSWTGTDQFSFSQVTSAIQRRRNQFLVETGAVLTRVAPAAIAPLPLGRFPLSDSVIDVRRASFKMLGDTTFTNLWRSDEWATGAATGMSYVQNPGRPSVYMLSATPPITIQLAPPPAASGLLDLIRVDVGVNLNPAAGVALGIPDDFAWVIKWGALADLLGADGQARDPGRAAYCQSRWEEGIALARIYTSCVQLQVNDVPVYLASLQSLDSGNYAWQTTEGTPNVGCLAGLNLLVLAGQSPGSGGIPDGVYGISADVVRKAPVPTADGDYLQVGREELDAILRYAEHIACFKMAGMEFEATMPQYKGIMQEAAVCNDRLRANARDFNVLMDRATQEESRRPRRLEEAVA